MPPLAAVLAGDGLGQVAFADVDVAHNAGQQVAQLVLQQLLALLRRV